VLPRGRLQTEWFERWSSCESIARALPPRASGPLGYARARRGGLPARREDVLIGVLVVKQSDRYAYAVAEHASAGGKDQLIEGLRAVFSSIVIAP